MTNDDQLRNRRFSKLYDLPHIYDIAFSWDLSEEIDFFKLVFETHVDFPVAHILEPACGTGRFLRTLPDLQDLLRLSGQFEITAIYGEDFAELKDSEHLSGELGNVYMILRKTCAAMSSPPENR